MALNVEFSSKIDERFVIELAKRGRVHLLSSQVTVEGNAIDLEGLAIPEGVTIDHISATPTKDEWRPVASITFRFPD